MFAELRQAISKPPRRERHFQAWIYPETWSMIDTRMEARRRKDQRISQALARAIKATLQGDRPRQAARAGSAVEPLIISNPPLIREAWIRIRGWYKEAVYCPPPPDKVTLATMMAEREELYRYVPFPGDPIPVEYPPFPFSVDDSIPKDGDITWAVCRLLLNRSGSPSGIRVEPPPVADCCDAVQLACCRQLSEVCRHRACSVPGWGAG